MFYLVKTEFHTVHASAGQILSPYFTFSERVLLTQTSTTEERYSLQIRADWLGARWSSFVQRVLDDSFVRHYFYISFNYFVRVRGGIETVEQVLPDGLEEQEGPQQT